jgi:hypothetical protein
MLADEQTRWTDVGDVLLAIAVVVVGMAVLCFVWSLVSYGVFRIWDAVVGSSPGYRLGRWWEKRARKPVIHAANRTAEGIMITLYLALLLLLITGGVVGLVRLVT